MGGGWARILFVQKPGTTFQLYNDNGVVSHWGVQKSAINKEIDSRKIKIGLKYKVVNNDRKTEIFWFAIWQL